MTKELLEKRLHDMAMIVRDSRKPGWEIILDVRRAIDSLSGEVHQAKEIK